MIARSALLTFRINRFEALIVAGATLLSVLVSAAVIGWVTANDYSTCAIGSGEPFRPVCHEALGAWIARIARLSTVLVPFFPFLAGLLLGVPIIARELESGTARLAWSLGPSRLRWFVQRVVPTFALAVACAFVIGVVADALYTTLSPDQDMSRSFVGHRGRGVLVAANAALVGSVALFLGAFLGRVVPAFILAIALSGAIGLGIDRVERTAFMAEAVPGNPNTWDQADLYLDGRYQLADGRLVTWEELVVIRPQVEWEGPTEPYVPLIIPGARYQEIELRGTAMVVALSAVFLAGAATVVLRRRPR